MSITRLAYAKINITLDILSRREDGYHDIRSVMQAIALHDTLTVTLTPDTPGVQLSVDGDEAGGVPCDASNIVHKAAVRLQKIAAARGILPGNQSGLRIHLTKRIPNQAGLGGGSSDAAAALKAVSELYNFDLSLARLTDIAAALGADVPFFLHGGTALVEGLGERVLPLSPIAPLWHLVIIKPPVGVSTPGAYAALDNVPMRLPGQSTSRWLLHARDSAPGNDFEQVVLPIYPEIKRVFDLLAQTTTGGDSFRPTLCGSGAAVFCRASSESEAEQIASYVRAANAGKVWVTQTQGMNDDS